MAQQKANLRLRERIAGLTLGIGIVMPVAAAEIVGRVVDNLDAHVFPGVSVQLRDDRGISAATRSNEYGFFRIADVKPGPGWLELRFPDGRELTVRLLVARNLKTQFVEIDYSRIVPPEHEDSY